MSSAEQFNEELKNPPTQEPSREEILEEELEESSRQREEAKSVLHSSLRNITPVRLGLLLFVNFALASLFCFVAVTTIKQHEHAIKVIGYDSAPSVIASYQINTAVAAMESDLAAELLTEPGSQACSDYESDFTKWRDLVGNQLILTARNITFDKEKELIETVQSSLSRFQMKAQEARDLHHFGKNEEALSAYRTAALISRHEILAATDSLKSTNSDALEQTYAQERSAANLTRGLAIVMGMFLITALAYTHFYLSRRFHRRICPPILLSLICVGLVLNHLSTALADYGLNMKIAKEDAYDSVLSLLNTRADAYEAVAFVTGALLDEKRVDEDFKQYRHKINSIAGISEKHNFADIVDLAEKQLKSGEKLKLEGFSGSLAAEIHNVCFPGEVEAAVETLKYFAATTNSFDNVIKLTNENKKEAIASCLSFGPAGARFPFVKCDDALVRTLQINQDNLDKAVAAAFHSLAGLTVEIDLICILTVVCVYLGLLPRMEEYVHRRPGKNLPGAD